MNLFDFNLVLAEASSTPEAGSGGFLGSLGMLIPMLLIFVAFYFILIRPQKKKEKEAANMRDSLEIGDEIVTIGGIIGRVGLFQNLSSGSPRRQAFFNGILNKRGLRSLVSCRSPLNREFIGSLNVAAQKRQLVDYHLLTPQGLTAHRQGRRLRCPSRLRR